MADFALDNNVSIDVATHLKARGHSAVTARTGRLWRASDDEHLWRAAQAHRIFVTHDEKDFTLLHRAWLRWGVPIPHAGIAAVPQAGWSDQRIADELHALVRHFSPLTNELYHWRQPLGWVLVSAP